jgi:DNA polymerase III sliding clamp (beta) subunit (PCNA family)
MHIDRGEFLAALKAVAVFARGTTGISVAYSGGQSGKLVISARSQDAGEGDVEVAASISSDADETALFNHKYLTDALSYLTGKSVTLKLNSPTQPVILESKDNSGYLYLVMPIKT